MGRYANAWRVSATQWGARCPGCSVLCAWPSRPEIRREPYLRCHRCSLVFALRYAREDY